MTTRGTRNESNRIDSNRELECSAVGSLYDRAESNRSVFADNVALPAARPVSPDCRARSSKPAAATGWDGRTNGRPSDAVASRRLYILCWRELRRRRLLPAVSPAAGHLTTPTAAGLPGLCENFRPTTSKSSPI